MGLLDMFKSGPKGEVGRSPKDSIKDVKDAAQASNYNQASIFAFYALENLGKSYVDLEREPYVTAREYAGLLVEEGQVTNEDLDPIVSNFEISKYSPMEVTFEDYRKAEESLDNLYDKLKSGKPTQTAKKMRGSGGARKGKVKRKRKRPTGAGARARSRRSS